MPRVPESLAELPTHDDACRLAVAPDDAGPARGMAPGNPPNEGLTAPAPSWWQAWKPLVYAVLAPGRAARDVATPDCTAGGCITLVDASGGVLLASQSAAVIVSPACPQGDVCANDACTSLVLGDRARDLHATATIP
jgi:hypothetical protein